MEFDAKRDRGIARDVPHEALRRFHADIRARRERAEQALVEFHSTYAEKERRVREWIGENGTADQRARLAAGVLPLEEAVDAMTEEAFRMVDHLPRYQQDGVARLQAHLRDVSALREGNRVRAVPPRIDALPHRRDVLAMGRDAGRSDRRARGACLPSRARVVVDR